MNVTIAYITGRLEPKLEWFFDSLWAQQQERREITVSEVLVVDAHYWAKKTLPLQRWPARQPSFVRHLPPKPTIWQGPHRVTSQDWWAMSNARNTALCVARSEWIAFLDDRCVLQYGWLRRLERHMIERPTSVLAGSYTKLSGMDVDYGRIVKAGEVIGRDARRAGAGTLARNVDGGYLFGCNFALPLEYALNVNGFEEGCDGLSMEDVIFGLNLKADGYSIDYDPMFGILEDRTPGEIATNHAVDGVFKRTDKGVSPNDKSHAALARFGSRARTEFTPDLRAIRHALFEECGTFPLPDPHTDYHDWYDGELINGI